MHCNNIRFSIIDIHRSDSFPSCVVDGNPSLPFIDSLGAEFISIM